MSTDQSPSLNRSENQTDASEEGFDPTDWEPYRTLGHQLWDDMVDYVRDIAKKPAWQEIPKATKTFFEQGLPTEPRALDSVLDDIRQHVMPYPTGNIHPRFWSWVGGTGTPQAMLADMIISGMNSCALGFDEAAPTYVELQLLNWLKEMFGMPADTSGLLVSGGSMANLVGLAVARNSMAGYDLRQEGVVRTPRLRFYASTEAHSSVQKAIELLGLGTESLVKVEVRDDFTIDVEALRQHIANDLSAGHHPIGIVANAGTVNSGATDPLNALADICDEHRLWLHVDGAFGALAVLSKTHGHLLRGLERADSLAFDLHKWMYQQYDIGCALVRGDLRHRNTFAITPAYLSKFDRGLAAGPTDFSAYGVQLSRSAKALRAWLTLQAEGVDKFARMVDQNIAQAIYLSERVNALPNLETVAPTALNIVNYRFTDSRLDADGHDRLNHELLMTLHTRGIAAPSSTRLNGRFCIRVAICNHRSRRSDFDDLAASSQSIGDELLQHFVEKTA